MFAGNALALGILAGVTIFLGLPIALLGGKTARVKGVLNAIAIGILLFLVVDVLGHGWEPVERAATEALSGVGPRSAAYALGALFAGGIAVGLLSLSIFEARYLRDGAATDPKSLALMIAIGIGMHNFSEGLAIGESAAQGLRLAVVLAIGFALHNATEGFGIAAPLHGTRPTWGFLLLLGLVGGGPTFLGAILGSTVTNPYLYVAFLALAGGALVYVVKELLYHGRRLAAPADSVLVMGGVALGILLGFGTDLIVALGGA